MTPIIPRIEAYACACLDAWTMYIERNMSAYVYNVFTVHNTDIEKQDAFKKQNVCIQPRSL